MERTDTGFIETVVHLCIKGSDGVRCSGMEHIKHWCCEMYDRKSSMDVEQTICFISRSSKQFLAEDHSAIQGELNNVHQFYESCRANAGAA